MSSVATGRVSSDCETAHTDAVADDDDRSRDSSSAAGPGWSDPNRPGETWAEAVAPDDLSELAHDIHAYHRERRAVRRRERYRRYLRRRGATPFALVIAALALVAVVTTLLTVMGPTTPGTPPASSPLAHPATAAGKVGGLLPAVALSSEDGMTLNSLAMRPGALALLSPQCDCDALVQRLDQAVNAGAHAALFVVAPSTHPNPDADTLQGRLRPVDDVLYDSAAALRDGVAAHGLTLVFVNRDGTIYAIKKDVGSTNGVKSDVLTMLSEPSPAS
jgi:hypothetical protein